jgi:predicted acylesterase/phospholipase RssA
MKYIVLSGGGPNCFSQLIMIHTLMNHNIIKYENIKKIYATSGGSIMATLIALNVPLDEVIDYIIERPWNKTIKFDVDIIFNFNDKKGFYDYELFYNMVSPIFLSNDISTDITLQNIYDHYKIELRFFTTELETFQSIELSYITHPNLKVIDAITMSSSFPPIFCPFLYEGKHYIDGGIFKHYPIDIMQRDVPVDEHDFILSINIRKLIVENNININLNLNDMNTYEYIQYLLIKGFKNVWNSKNYNNKYELYYDADHLMCDHELFTQFVNDINYRNLMKEKSILTINNYLNSLFKNIFNVENNGLAS